MSPQPTSCKTLFHDTVSQDCTLCFSSHCFRFNPFHDEVETDLKYLKWGSASAAASTARQWGHLRSREAFDAVGAVGAVDDSLNDPVGDPVGAVPVLCVPGSNRSTERRTLRGKLKAEGLGNPDEPSMNPVDLRYN